MSGVKRCRCRVTLARPPHSKTSRPILHRIDAEAQRVSRARSPVRAGISHVDPASKFESCFPCAYERGYEGWSTGAGNTLQFWMQRADDCRPYQGSGFDEAKSLTQIFHVLYAAQTSTSADCPHKSPCGSTSTRSSWRRQVSPPTQRFNALTYYTSRRRLAQGMQGLCSRCLLRRHDSPRWFRACRLQISEISGLEMLPERLFRKLCAGKLPAEANARQCNWW